MEDKKIINDFSKDDEILEIIEDFVAKVIPEENKN